MGIKHLSNVIAKHAPGAVSKTSMASLAGQTIGVDASIVLYQHMVALRGHGRPELANANGDSTAHIHAIITKTLSLLRHGIVPVYVFDGEPPKLKQHTLTKRREVRQQAKTQLEQATDPATRTALLKKTVSIGGRETKQCQDMLSALGVPFIVAPQEADSQLARLSMDGLVACVASEDMDLLTFGTKKLVRNFSARKDMQVVDLERLLREMAMTHDQFIDLCILLGCDYSPTIANVGPARAIEVIRRHGSIESFLQNDERIANRSFRVPANFNYQAARDYFRQAPAAPVQASDLVLRPVNATLVSSLLEGYGFAQSAITRVIKQLIHVHGQRGAGRLALVADA